MEGRCLVTPGIMVIRDIQYYLELNQNIGIDSILI